MQPDPDSVTLLENDGEADRNRSLGPIHCDVHDRVGSHPSCVPGRYDDPVFDDALRAVGQAAATAGKQAGILLKSPTEVPRYRSLGYGFIGMGSDYGHLRAAAHEAAAASRALLGD